jgi:hypothetical protein
MTGEESRRLKAGDRVFWLGDVKNQGTVKRASWSGVAIDWDDGDCTCISHNDMDRISRATDPASASACPSAYLCDRT